VILLTLHCSGAASDLEFTDLIQGEAMDKEYKTFRLRLRAQTASVHEKLEARLNAVGLTGKLEDYGWMLSCFLSLYRPLEAALRRFDGIDTKLDLAMRRKSHWLEADLRFLGHEPNAIADWPQLPRLKTISECLGTLYVIEGASLGGQVISRWLTKELGIGSDNGGRFFAAYGERTSEMWRSFIDVLEVSARVTANAVAIEQSAQNTFTIFHDCLGATRRDSHGMQPMLAGQFR
jgi:heme oxygenase (biliverdin-IX-beta and delta-forming)